MVSPTRKLQSVDTEDLVSILERLVWSGEGTRAGREWKGASPVSKNCSRCILRRAPLWDFAAGPVVKEPQVQLLAGELRSHMLCGMAKLKKKKKKENPLWLQSTSSSCIWAFWESFKQETSRMLIVKVIICLAAFPGPTDKSWWWHRMGWGLGGWRQKMKTDAKCFPGSLKPFVGGLLCASPWNHLTGIGIVPF